MSEKIKITDFMDDKEKMRDFKKLTREEFLNTYSYLHEEEYDLTLQAEADKVFQEGGVYVCPICDGKCQLCDDDYQCSECEKEEETCQ